MPNRGSSNVFCVDYKMAGIGSNACGPELAEKYRIELPKLKAEFHMSLILSPVTNNRSEDYWFNAREDFDGKLSSANDIQMMVYSIKQ